MDGTRLCERWRRGPGLAVVDALSKPAERGRLIELCSRLEGVEEVPGGLDFRHIDLDVLWLSAADLREAVFDGARIQNVVVQERADLRRASFREATLVRAHLGSCGPRLSLRGADFSSASLRFASFERAMTAEVIFRGADLWRSNFAGADLRDADLRDVDARESPFGGARLSAGTRVAGARFTADYLPDELARLIARDGGEPEGAGNGDLDEVLGTLALVAASAPTGCRTRVIAALEKSRAKLEVDPACDWLAHAHAAIPPGCYSLLDECFEEYLAESS